ncbi:MAG TPA: methyltransferase, partial [Candidatus Limnocylindrales bacterium]|nr:methyltransferase [Candidatus Limnocylindrales bacterium]
HPCLLDACLQPIAAALSPAERAGSYMPVAVESLDWRGRPAARAWSHVRLTARPGDGGALAADVRVVDDSGAVLIALEGLRLVRASREALARLGRVRDLLYTVEWRPAPLPAGAGRPAAADLAEPAAIAAEVTVGIEDVRARQGLDAYEAIGPELDAVSSMYVARALHELGWAPALGDPVSASNLAGRLHVAPRHEALLARFLEILAEDGILRQAGGGWIATRTLDARDPAARLALLRDRHPEAWAEITITERCGASLAGALSGRIDPLDLLFPGGSTETAEALYTASPPARACGELVAAAVSAAVRELPPGRPLRVLEVGGGTGGTTAAVLPALPRERTEYVFTDVSPAFTSRAAERFREWPFLRTRPLDLERDPLEQGFPAHAFDLVIAANVVHATRDLRRTLDRCRRLMAPGGLLVLLEVTAPQRWIDLTFGLTEGWWHFTDRDLRPGYPLLSAARWRELLAESGFAEAAAVPPAPAGAGTFAANTVLVARAPREAPAADRAAWLVVGDGAGVGEGLAVALEGRGQRAVLASAGTACGARGAGEWSVRPGVSGDLVRLVAEAHGGAGWRGVVHCRAIDALEGERGADLDGAQRDACGSLLDLVNALATPAGASAPTAPAAPPLWLVTRGAQPVGEGKVAVSQAPALGLARTIALEHPELRCARIDVDPEGGPTDVSALAAEIIAADAEDEVAYRGGARHVARLTARPAPDRPDGRETGVLKVVTGTAGSLDSLMLRPADRRPPGPGEVEIEVRATGLNFKDVLNVLGMYPGDPGPLGSECAGTISAVGPLVAGLQPGQAVVAVAPGSFATHVTTGAGL